METFIELKEFQSLILNIILSKEYKHYIENTVYEGNKDFEIGFMLGMNWAALNSVQCQTYYGMKEN